MSQNSAEFVLFESLHILDDNVQQNPAGQVCIRTLLELD
jgi:hypothetical protein